MAAFQHLLQRLGFVKLGRFGLELTPDGRVLSTRPAVLDDGTGGRIVGWEDGDFAVAELPSWRPSSDAPAPPIARGLATPRVAPPPRRARPPAVPPAIPAASRTRPAPVAAPATAMPVEVAAAPAVDEDDWEWTIALARARAEGEPAQVRPAPRAASPTTRAMAAVALDPPAVVAPEPVASAPRTAPPSAALDEDYAAMPTRPMIAIPSVARPRQASVMPIAAPSLPAGATPSTVIPVPTLPTVQSTAHASRLAPVVRTVARRAEAPRRFPKGTGPQEPATTPDLAAISEDTITNLSVGDRTRQGVAVAAPSSRDDDRTRPGIALPPAARTVALPSIKRRLLSR